jgi:predicted transglutaminase-like cysteine proteinase
MSPNPAHGAFQCHNIVAPRRLSARWGHFFIAGASALGPEQPAGWLSRPRRRDRSRNAALPCGHVPIASKVTGTSRSGMRHALIGVMTLLLVCAAHSATAIDASRPPSEAPSLRLPVGAPALPPFGHTRYCASATHHCRPVPPADGFAPTASRVAELDRVNRRVNRSIVYRSDDVTGDEIDLWESRVRQGDCEDYALTKREELIDLGWPSRRLLLAMALTEDGVGHVVVIVRLEDSDLVLDNLSNRIVAWHATSHRYLKVQSAADPTRWHATLESVAASPL